MGIADDMRKISESSDNDDKIVKWRIDQLHKMIFNESKRGGMKLRVSPNFFKDEIGHKVADHFESEGFIITPPTDNDVLEGVASSLNPNFNEWTIYWHYDEEPVSWRKWLKM